ncbi:HEAT repeat-containing protein 4 [Boothiomyces sp. JEL0866]|nr:HEAT repeat-containing protein 4 [Boothiomyces sp. JEL0866]
MIHKKENRKRNVRHSKGFKNLVNVKVTPTEDYKRPHRKQLMETIFRTDINRRIRETEKTIEVVSELPEPEYLSQPGVDLAVGIDLRTRRKTKNALVTAIDQTMLPHSDMYMIRQPIKIPPNYKKRLESLQKIGLKFQQEREKYEKERKLMDEARIKLKFAPPEGYTLSDLEKKPPEPQPEEIYDAEAAAMTEEDAKSVASDSMPPTPSSAKHFFERKSVLEASGLPSIIGSTDSLTGSDKLQPAQSFISSIPRKSSTLQNNLTSQTSFLNIPRRQSRLQSQASSTGMSAANEEQKAEASENWQARNVPYMLAIWGKAEGIDVEKYIPKRRPSLKKDSSKMNVTKGEPRQLGIGSTSFWRRTSKIDFMMENLRRQSKFSGDNGEIITEGGILKEEAISSAISEEKNSAKCTPTTISDGTYELLKKFSRDTVTDEPQIEVFSDETMVKRVLTGFGVKGLTDLNSHEALESINLENNTPSEKKRHSSPFKNVTPGNCSKVIGEFISDDGDLLIPKSLEDCHKDSFEFKLPEQQTNDEDFKNQQKDSNQIAIVDENHVDGIYDQMSQKLQNLFGKNVSMPKRIRNNPNEIFTPINIGNDKGEAVIEYTTKNEINLKKFNAALKNNIMSNACSLENKLLWNSYLDSFTAKMFEIPKKHSNEWNELQRVAVAGVKQETDRAILSEAVCILIQIGGESALGRWDTIIFKQFINELMDIGTFDQKQIVSIYYVKQAKVDKRVVDQIYLGLGELNQDKRKQTLSILSSLDIRFADYIVAACKRDVSHSNWRVRLDVIYLLSSWMTRLAPIDNAPPPKRDPDALETDDDATVKALFYTLGTTTLEQAEETPATEHRASIAQIIQMDDEPPPKVNEEANADLFGECVQILLGLMWSDWSEDVRDAANAALGNLNQGKPVYDWILLQLEKPDPVKRVDALKSLTSIGVLFKNNIKTFLKCFQDPYASVRIAACKVACVLESPEREIVTEIMGLLDDHNYKVRAYAVKALGLSKFKGAKIRQSLNWALQHDDHPAVRAEAIRAVFNLGMIQDDPSIKDGVLTLLATDKAEKVQKEAERVLVLSNVIFPSIKGDDKDKTEGRVKVDGTPVSPYPHILGDKSAEEVAIYLSTSLIGDHEINSVINKVRLMSTKEAMMSKVDEIGGKFKHVKVQGLDLKYDSKHRPLLSEVRTTRASIRKRMETKGVSPNSIGIPEIKSNPPIKS